MIARIFWTLLFLGVCIGWLVVSYQPELFAGKEFAFGPATNSLFLWLFAASALLFVVIQILLVVGTRTFPTRIARDSSGESGEKEIRINPAAELFWTALPLLISLLFFGVVWQFLLK